MKKYLKIYFIFLSISLSWCDVNWSTIIGQDNTKNEGWYISKSSYGGFIIGGMIDYKAAIVKINAQGEEEWQKLYHKGVDDVLKCIVPTSDGGYVAAGYFTETEAPYLEKLWLIKINDSGNLLWEQIHGNENKNSWAENIIESQDGNYVVLGTTDDDGDNAKALLQKYNYSGNLLWSQTYTSSNYNEGISLIEDTAGDLVFVGFSGTSHGAYKHFMVKANSDGETIWKKRFGNNTQQSLNSVCEDIDGNYVATGYCNNYDDLYIIKRDATSGEKIWDTVIDALDSDMSDTDQGNQIILSNEGGFYILGSSNVWPNSTGQDDYWLLKIDGSGNLLWDELFGFQWFDYGHSLLELDNGEIVLLGTVEYENSYDSDIWIVNINPNEMMSEIIENKRISLYSKIFPNPFNPIININLSINKNSNVKVNVYDIKGTEIDNLLNDYKVIGEYELSWDASIFPSGIYFLKIFTDTHILTSKMVLAK